MFNWPDGDVILRCTHGSNSRDFRVHKLFLSFASPVFKDMFKLPQPAPATSTVDIIDLVDSPRAVEYILRFIYPSSPPAIDDLTLLSEILILADKYDIEAARSRLRPLFIEFAKSEPLRAYAIACRLGFEDETKIASSYTTSIHLPGITELPDEFRFIPATDYHRLILLHARYRKEVEAIAVGPSLTPSATSRGGLFFGVDLGSALGTAMRRPVVDSIRKGTPLNYEALTLAVKADHNVDVAEADGIGKLIRSTLDKANALNLTV